MLQGEALPIDAEYLNRIIAYFILVAEKNPHCFIPLTKLTKDNEKYIRHVKYYIDIRTREFPDVHFTDDYSQIYIS